jgi:hypothetical protein
MRELSILEIKNTGICGGENFSAKSTAFIQDIAIIGYVGFQVGAAMGAGIGAAGAGRTNYQATSSGALVVGTLGLGAGLMAGAFYVTAKSVYDYFY